MLPELTTEEFSHCLDRQVARVLQEAEVTQPPIDAIEVAQSIGMAVAWDDTQPGRARLVRLPSGKYSPPHDSILIKPEPRSERRQWAVAHEIGESIAYRVFADLGVNALEAPVAAREDVANRIGTRLLLPHDWFKAVAFNSGWDLAEIKQQFSTASHEVIARRMLDYSLPVIITICDQGQVSFRHRNTPGPTAPLCPLEQRCLRAVHTRGRAEQLTDGELSAQGWPVHEDDWKREILRLELPEVF